jgi:hypothetical protein
VRRPPGFPGLGADRPVRYPTRRNVRSSRCLIAAVVSNVVLPANGAVAGDELEERVQLVTLSALVSAAAVRPPNA